MAISKWIVGIALLSITINTSCKKSSSGPTGLPVMWNFDTLMPSESVYLWSPSYLNVDGIFMASKTSGILTDTTGTTNIYSRKWEAALLAGNNNYTYGASVVTLNSVSLDTANSWCPSFTNDDTVATWNENGTNHWSITSSTNMPSFTADVAGTMPAFTAALPVNIDTTTDFHITFNSSNTTNADYAFIVIGNGPEYSGVVSANGGVLTISKSRLTNFRNAYMYIKAGTNRWFYGGQIMIVLYKENIQTINGKQYAFINESEYFGIINFM